MKHVKGNLLDTDLMFIAHGCNCQDGFGSGVAGAIAQRHPEVKQAYHAEIANRGRGPHNLGKWFLAYTEDQAKVFINCFTQNKYGSDGAKYASYTAVVQALTDFVSGGYVDRSLLGEIGTIRIAIPEIGCGLGGLKWPMVAELLLEIEERFNVEFTVYRI